MDDDGFGSGFVPIRVEITVRGSKMRVDYTGSAPQTQGSVNAVESIAPHGGLLRPALPGALRHTGTTRAAWIPSRSSRLSGTVVNAEFPAAVAGGNVETSQRMVDVILGALAKACPGKIPAASCGTMNNLTVGGMDHRAGPRQGRPYAYYETTGGGMGGGPWGDGEDAIHTHLTNTLNTPIEALEHAYPFRVSRYTVRRGSGGAGKHRGGDGIIREIELLGDATVSFMTERREKPPWPLNGGEPGMKGRNSLIQADETQEFSGKARLSAKRGDRIRLETPGGGGWGRKN